tara:strand:+ start:189 stop:557 length:369 start_codon:yes stop_codon:yes gene_type:complete
MKTEYFRVWISDEVKGEPETAAFFAMIDKKTQESGKNVPLFSNKEVEDSNKQNTSPKTYDNIAVFVNKAGTGTMYGNLALKFEKPPGKDESALGKEPVREKQPDTVEDTVEESIEEMDEVPF